MTTLIVDDEPAIRALVRAMIAPLGHSTLEAGCGAEALALVDGRPVDLLISDVVMPGMDGVELAREFQKKFPAIKVLLISGNCDGFTLDNPGMAFLRKPFQVPDFLEAVRDLLTPRSAALRSRPPRHAGLQRPAPRFPQLAAARRRHAAVRRELRAWSEKCVRSRAGLRLEILRGRLIRSDVQYAMKVVTVGVSTMDELLDRAERSVQRSIEARLRLQSTTPAHEPALRTPDAVSAGLTPREVEVISQIAAGKSTKEIAYELGITFKTAACHRQRIMSKLSIHETAGLVRWAIRHGLVRP